MSFSVVAATPSTPTGVVGVAFSGTRIDVTWNPSTSIGGYIKGYRVIVNNAQVGLSLTTSYSINNLTANTTYKISIVATDNSRSNSRPSFPIYVTTLAASNNPIIGAIGCSMTMGALKGTTGSISDFWSDVQYGGGNIGAWSRLDPKYWDEFQRAYDARPTNIIWWQLCTLANDVDTEGNPNDTFEHALIVLEELQARVSNAIIYVSAQPSYNPIEHECTLAGANGPTNMASIAATLATMSDTDNILVGPSVGPLDASTQISTDTCHANTAGQNFMGQQLINFGSFWN
ncbi:MAG: fibronectin type III domain-containing protein [Nitrososphaeraceae archaeon]